LGDRAGAGGGGDRGDLQGRFLLAAPYLPLAPILFLARGAITRDLGYLKTEIERA
jgi:hypothetical protein